MKFKNVCGIVGFLGKKEDYHLLEKMNHTQTHRGPDSKGHFHCKKNNLFIGMARLSIVDINWRQTTNVLIR